MNPIIPVFTRFPSLVKELTKVLPSVNFHEVKNPESDPYFKNSEILICDYDLLGPHLYDLPTKTKWVQGTWAGIEMLTPFIQKEKILPYQITRFTGEHFGRQMSEYVVANIVNHERDLFELKEYQRKGEWKREGKIVEYRLISDLTIGILGLGNIGSRIGKVLKVLGAEIIGFGRRPSLPDGAEYSHVTKYYTKETLPSLLQKSDYIINVLPQTEETNSLLDDDILKNCAEKQTVFINIGRSNVISEQSLIKALNNKWLSSAIVDVFEVEPLPGSSPLWKMDQVFITSHVAGVSRPKDLADQFRSNYDSYLKKVPVPSVIDFSKGY